jgi:hypothetical protein
MNSDPKDDGAGLAFGGKTEIAILVMTLRPDEAPLGELALVDWRWLETAMTHLTQIDQSRRAVNVCDNAYCTFDVGLAYFQCLAPPFGSYLRCETVSEKCVPEIAEILTPEKRDRLVHEFGFSSSTKNFEQRIAINGDEDLAYVARMAFRVLKDIYGVKDFGAAKFKLSMPKPALPVAQAIALPISPAMVPAAEKPYVVLVDDNFHYQKEEERYRAGDYATLEEAVSKCRSIVDDFLKSGLKHGMSSKELYEQYCMFGEDPFIRGPEAGFSAWDYARQRCDELCRSQSDSRS